ncbi:MAG: hypothetical protein ACMXYG_06130 [Candidatus Woesearchaeota archaeon]
MFFSKWKSQEKINNKVEVRLEKLDNSLQDSFKNVKDDVTHLKQWVNYLHHGQDKINANLVLVNHRLSDILTKQEIKHFVDEYYANIETINKSLVSMRSEFNEHIGALYSNQKSIFQRLEEFSKTIPNRNEMEQEIKLKMHDFKQDIRRDLRQDLRYDLRHDLRDDLRVELKEEIISSLPKNPAISQLQPIQTLPEVTIQTPAVFQQLSDLNNQISELKTNLNTLQDKTSPKQNLKERIFKKVTRHSKEYVKSMLMSLIKKHQKISGLDLREIVVEDQGIVSKSSFYRILTEIEEEEGIHVLHEGKEKHYFYALDNAVHPR